MNTEEKQIELQRHRDIILATIDYLISTQAGSLVFDQQDPVADYFEQQKLQIEKYYQQRRMDRLQQRLASLTKGMQSRADLDFADYIKEKTGHDIDIFEDLRNRVNAILAQKEIRNQEELNDIGAMFHLYQETPAEKEMVVRLQNLLVDYSQRTDEPATTATSLKKKAAYSEIINRVEKDGKEEVTVRISTGPKPAHLEEQETVSPDGKRLLRVTRWSGGKQASTYVVIVFPAASGSVYATNGICPDIKASWKDNSTIIIETKKDYTANTQHKEVRSFEDIITIEYKES